MTERRYYISLLFPGTENNGRFNEPILDFDYPEREGAAMYARLKVILRLYGVRTEDNEIPQHIRTLALQACSALKSSTKKNALTAKKKLFNELRTAKINILITNRHLFAMKTIEEIREKLLHEVEELFQS